MSVLGCTGIRRDFSKKALCNTYLKYWTLFNVIVNIKFYNVTC